MYDSLVRVLGRLPPDTLVYCGHEYTVANLEFASSVGEPGRGSQGWREAALQQVPPWEGCSLGTGVESGVIPLASCLLSLQEARVCGPHTRRLL